MKILKIIRCRSRLAVCALLFITAPSWAATYYVDATLGDDTRDGLSETNAWKSVAKVNATAFLPGDSILFKCGETWREQLVVPSSGTLGNSITFGRYGADCNDSNKPLLLGSDIVTGWTLSTGNAYVSSPNLIRQPTNLVENGSLDLSSAGWGLYGGVIPSWAATGCEGAGGCLMVQVSTGNGAASTKRFVLEPGINYRLEFKMRASSPMSVSAVLNRDSAPWAVASFPSTANTAWTPYAFDFTPNQNLQQAENIRVDFWVSTSAAGTTYYIDDVRLTTLTNQYDNVKQVYVDGAYAILAQHPNPNPNEPTDTFLKIGADSANCPAPGQPGGTTLITGSDFGLDSAQASDLVGAGIHVRTTRWYIDDNVVSAFIPGTNGTNTISLNSTTQFSICKDWGYYLDNRPWMLDSPGEWYYSSESGQLSLWMPDSSQPGSRVEAVHRDGLSVVGRAYIVFDGLSLEKTGNAIDMRYSSNVTVRNTSIKDTHGSGILANYSSNALVDRSLIENTVREGIVISNSISPVVSSCVFRNTGTVGSPKKSGGAISGYASIGAFVGDNYIENSGYNGIFVDRDFQVLRNRIYGACQVLDDCGAIYIGGSSAYSENGTITNNIIVGTGSALYGRPNPEKGSASQGVYLDSRTDGTEVRGNTVVGTDLGIQVHIADTNHFIGNTVYASRQWPVYVSETSEMGIDGSGGVHDNEFIGNSLFPILVDGTYRLYGQYENINFGTYGGNRYSSLYSDVLVSEEHQSGGTALRNAYTLYEWQQLGRDVGSTSFDVFSIASYRVTALSGMNLIGNSTFGANPSQWNTWNGTNVWVSSCITGGCLMFTRDSIASDGATSSYPFSIQVGSTYLVKFDLRGGQEGQTVSVFVNRAGTPYNVVGLNTKLIVGTGWQTYAFVMTATETRDASVPGSGARLDLHVPAANQSIYLDNVRVEAIGAEYNDVTDDSAILINTGAVAAGMACPDATTNPSKCSQYVRFIDSAPVIWPLTVPALGSEIVVWAENPMKDSDRDGVADTNDICANTTAGLPVNENGCSFAQAYDPDSDGVYTGQDNCPTVANSAQTDSNANGVGDACDPVDLSLSLTDTPDPSLIGDTVTYNLTVTNTGPSPASGVTVTGTLPSCDLGTIASNASASCTRTVTASTAGTLSHTMTANAAEYDSNPGNNTTTANTTVNPSCKLASGYSLSGTVKTSGGTAIPGVTLTLAGPNSCGDRMQTDTRGKYKFLPLQGSYTVTPSKAGCSSFDPPSKTLAISKNKTQNFTGVCP